MVTPTCRGQGCFFFHRRLPEGVVLLLPRAQLLRSSARPAAVRRYGRKGKRLWPSGAKRADSRKALHKHLPTKHRSISPTAMGRRSSSGGGHPRMPEASPPHVAMGSYQSLSQVVPTQPRWPSRSAALEFASGCHHLLDRKVRHHGSQSSTELDRRHGKRQGCNHKKEHKREPQQETQEPQQGNVRNRTAN